MSDLKQYLGDSVYADVDGFAVRLTTENGLRNDPSNTIVLEPEVLRALVKYCRQLRSPYPHIADACVAREPVDS